MLIKIFFSKNRYSYGIKSGLYLIITILLTLGLSLSFQSLLAAWTQPPPGVPPAGNINPPINEGGTAQAKIGGLSIGGNFNVGNPSILNVNTATGRVGIGTASPGATLEVNGSLKMPTNKQILLRDDTAGIYSSNTNEISIFTSGGNRLTVNSSGSVGIGTASPGTPLEVNKAGAGIISSFYGASGSGDTEIHVGNSGAAWDNGVFGYNSIDDYAYLSVFGLNRNRLIMTNAGNVGIGTQIPGLPLEVTKPGPYNKPASGVADGSAWLYLLADGSADNAIIWNAGRDLRFGTETSKGSGWVEQARITAGGDVCNRAGKCLNDAACTLCESCGGTWPSYQGEFGTDDDGIKNVQIERGPGCSGNLEQRGVNGSTIKLCCR